MSEDEKKSIDTARLDGGQLPTKLWKSLNCEQKE